METWRRGDVETGRARGTDGNGNGDMAQAAEASPWHFCQCFGEKGALDDLTDADILSAVEFDETGDYLATGDKGGRIVIFERAQPNKASGVSRERQNTKGVPLEYNFFAEFQSHEPEFDYLKSLEIEEKINKIKWCKRTSNGLFLLSTNGAYDTLCFFSLSRDRV